MRRVLHGDVSAVACVLFTSKKAKRDQLLKQIFAESDAAQSYRKCHHGLHPVWGDGSLMSAALSHPYCAEPFLDQPDYAACMAMVFNALAARGRSPEA